MKVPKLIKEHLANARYYLRAVDKLPPRDLDGIRIFLLLTAWENMTLADEKLHAWVQKIKTAKALTKSHIHKLQKVRGPLIRVVIPKKAGPDGIRRATTTEYSKPEELAELLEICRYGPKGGSADLDTYFQNRWFTDELERNLQSRIGWTEMMIGIYEKHDLSSAIVT